jgi:hypothetical protein
VAAKPGLEGLALVTAPGHAIEDRVVAHEELDPASFGGVSQEHAVTRAGEGEEGEAFREVGDQVDAARLCGLVAGRAAEVEGEVAFLARDPFGPVSVSACIAFLRVAYQRSCFIALIGFVRA